jgi:hypothetical protein
MAKTRSPRLSWDHFRTENDESQLSHEKGDIPDHQRLQPEAMQELIANFSGKQNHLTRFGRYGIK